MRYKIGRSIVWIAALLIASSGAAMAQLQTGSLFGIVLDPQHNPLPGATVTLSGIGAPQTLLSDAQGRFHYVGLAPGTYRLEAHHNGFSPLEMDDLTVHVGRNTDVEVTLPPGITETMTVTGEAPLLDERRFSKGNTFTLNELERIPTARDPWSVISSTPGVLMDRINVGGSETGSQARIVGPGSTGDQVVWALDGMIITDMAALGSAPGFFDFDSFEEIEVTTGGSDASIASGGVVLNMVTKRGTNQWRGSGRFYYANDNLRSKLDIDQSELGQAGAWNRFNAQKDFKQGNRIDFLRDWGVEGGGPVLTDRLWLWGSYARPVIRKLTNEDYADEELTTAWNFKLNGAPREGNSFTAFAWDDDKIKHGMNASSLHPPETTWDRSDYGAEPTAWKLEDTQIFNPSFYATTLYSRVNGGFVLNPAGGEKLTFEDEDGVWHNSYAAYVTDRPQKQVQADASNYFNTGRWSHELKYGAGYRIVEVRSMSRFPGGGLEFGPGLLFLSREGVANIDAKYTSGFVQDTLASGRLTVNLGLRWDRQTGSNLPTTVSANPVAPDLLPAAHYDGGDAGFAWENLVPRLGATWALGEKRNTLLRASYSRYADQLGTQYVAWTNPVAYMQYRYFYTDNGGDPDLERNEILDEFAPPTANVNPVTFGALSSNAVAGDFEAPMTEETLLGVEHSFGPDFVVGLQASYRHFTGLVEREALVFDGDAFSEENLGKLGRPHRRDDYVYHQVQITGPDGQPYTIRIGELRPGVSTRNGLLLRNGDREQVYKGLFLTLNKRLTNGWMARGHISLQDWRWRIPNDANEDQTDDVAGGIKDGSEVLSGGQSLNSPKGNVFISNGWSYSFTGLYQIARSRPWGFNVAAGLNGREGYPIRYTQRVFRSTVNTGRPTYIPVTADTGRFKYPDVHVLDLRVEKDFALQDLGFTVGFDVFNALNESYVLQRALILGRPNSDHVIEVLSPRIFRLGVRFRLR
ncbi:MAG TPA: carboxypeptidase regulatory-like domain-containing protein [Thermoanaerobaculia bacterium]|nr:carboxypeptidase regulatory-like domain-containing protein [Thermoanaerobaculia bacterium]